MIDRTEGIAVVGAGIVGLSVGWFLQERGYEVTVLERREPAAGSSAGNAGWLSPGFTMPLPEPSALAAGARSLIRRDAPLRIPPRSLFGATGFLLSFAAHCTARRWLDGVGAFEPICALARDACDRLADGGMRSPAHDAPIVAAFGSSEEGAGFRHELESLLSVGFKTEVTELDEDDLRRDEPLLSSRMRYGVRIENQRYVQPLEYTLALAESFTTRGGRIEAGTLVQSVRSTEGSVLVGTAGGERRFGAAVIANGAWMRTFARSLGIKVKLAAGRGYSFVSPCDHPIDHPLYLPGARVACTPAPGGVRVAGTMEITSPDAPFNPRRIEAIQRAAAGSLSDGVHLDTVSNPWVGPRPVTADGLPVIGRTTIDRVFVAGGHGMWGMTLGPVTGLLLAEMIETGAVPAALARFEPTR